VVADLTRGSGRFNVAQGAVATVQGLGAALSATVAGVIIVSQGYSIAFWTLVPDPALVEWKPGKPESCPTVPPAHASAHSTVEPVAPRLDLQLPECTGPGPLAIQNCMEPADTRVSETKC
jgi:hypothetical protein